MGRFGGESLLDVSDCLRRNLGSSRTGPSELVLQVGARARATALAQGPGPGPWAHVVYILIVFYIILYYIL